MVAIPGRPALLNPNALEVRRGLGNPDTDATGRPRTATSSSSEAGPGGLAAAVYGASEGLTTTLLECTALGGQAGTSSRIENYLGFPAGLSGRS